MEFKQAMRIWKRMCNKYDRCVGCPMYAKVDACPIEICDAEDDIDAILEKWAAEHPERTIADDFFEKHPKALRKSDGITPMACALHLGYCSRCRSIDSEVNVCAECWRQPLEEKNNV